MAEDGEVNHGILDREAARTAVALLLPSIERTMREPGAGDSGCLHVVVMDPLATADRCGFESAILHEHSIARERWDADYAGFAIAKARLAWRTGVDSHRLQALRPFLLEPGDTLLWGSVWLDGIVVGVSGLEAWYDEAVALAVAGYLRAAAKAGAQRALHRAPFLQRGDGAA